MKKIVFCLSSLNCGGVEAAFVNLTNKLDYKKYDVTVVLEKCEGMFLKELNKNVKVIDYHLSASNHHVILRKISNRLRLFKFIIKNYHKYDFSACYTTSSIVSSILARYLSKNNAIFVHGNLYHTKELEKEFFNYSKIVKFQKICFVSKALKTKYLEIVPNTNQKLYVSNNFINEDRILKLSLEKEIKKDKLTFVHIARQVEDEKHIYMLLEVLKKLNDDNFDFQVYMIGDGKDHDNYIKKVDELGLNNKIKFLGSLDNPYPYLRSADALLLTSPLEGNPVVFLEAKVLNVPIITTDVSDSLEDINNKYGLVSSNNKESYYQVLKKFMKEGFKIKKKFNPLKYNKEILENLDKLIGD